MPGRGRMVIVSGPKPSVAVASMCMPTACRHGQKALLAGTLWWAGGRRRCGALAAAGLDVTVVSVTTVSTADDDGNDDNNDNVVSAAAAGAGGAMAVDCARPSVAVVTFLRRFTRSLWP